MGDTWRDNDSAFEYVTRKKGRKKRGQLGRRHSQDKPNQDEASPATNNDDGRDRVNVEAVESEDGTEHEPDTPDRNEGPISFGSITYDSLTYDAIMSAPPKIKSIPSIEEDRGLASECGFIEANTKALPKEARTYQLETFKRNCLIIFNHELVDGFEPRLGTRQDADILRNTFENFGFKVIEHRDLTKERIIGVLETFKTTNFTEYGCIAIVVLTHGSYNGLLRAKDQEYCETEIINYFKVYDKPTLITKPKILIIQACRGTRCRPGVLVAQTSTIRKDLGEYMVEPYTLPVTSDMLVVHSSYVGEPSTRDEQHGSWFIQTLCRKINDLYISHDFESILTEMKREVASDRHWEEYNRSTREVDIYKQMPTVTSTLIRKLYLRRFGEDPVKMTLLDSALEPLPDAVTESAPTTPMLLQYGPCSCFLDHFHYIKKCLVYFLEENPGDSTARTFLEISNAFEDEDKFNAAKEKMAKAISEHLINNAKHHEFFKYLYFYKHRS